MRTGVLLAALVAGDAANRSVDEATQALVDDVRELQRQNKLLRQQNALLLNGHPPQPPPPQPQREARASDLERERGPEYTTNNPYDRAQYDELASQDSEWHAAWKRAKAEDHQVEWGEDHYNPWLPDPANSKKRPVPNTLWPAPAKAFGQHYAPGELMYRTWMVLSGKIQDGRMDHGKTYDDYVGHYCPAIFAPPIFQAKGGSLCRTCLTVVNELLDYLNTEQGGFDVPEAMRTDTDQMQTAFVKLCSLVADADPSMVLDCKNIVEYWGTEIWCHVATGVYIDEGDVAARSADCSPKSKKPCTVDKPIGKERNAWRICQHLKMAAHYNSPQASEAKKWCIDTGTKAGEGNDRIWHKWASSGQMPLCCPSMLVPSKKHGPEKGLVKAPAMQRSVAVFGKHYKNADMIDLRYMWHQKDQSDREEQGLVDPLPTADGLQEGIFNVGREW